MRPAALFEPSDQDVIAGIEEEHAEGDTAGGQGGEVAEPFTQLRLHRVEAGGNGQALRSRGHAVLGVPSARDERAHAIAWTPFRDACAEGVDGA